MPKADEFFGLARLLDGKGNWAVILFWVVVLICIVVVAAYLDFSSAAPAPFGFTGSCTAELADL